jgi:ParB family transcriptional regulator, chromosome partitioning protein
MNAFVRPARHVLLPIDEIDLSHTIRPYNAAVVAELAQSIRAIGLQTPLTCVIRDGRHILVAGRNRLEALRLVGAEQAPVCIVDFNDVEARLWQLSENLHRAELTKLQYDQQVVRYAELLKAKLAGETATPLPPQQQCQPEADKVRQVAAVSGGRGNTGGYREAARELSIPERMVRRAYQTASLAPEAQEAAVETGLDDNGSALLEAAKERAPEAQAQAIRRIAEQRASAAESLNSEAAATSQQSAKPLRDLVGISGGELARWIKITTPNDRPHVIRVLEMAAAILRDELEGLATGSRDAVDVEARDEVHEERYW